MSEGSVETRIKLPLEVHRQVKAEAVRHGIMTAEALGMCVAFVCSLTVPLRWVSDLEGCLDEIAASVMTYEPH